MAHVVFWSPYQERSVGAATRAMPPQSLGGPASKGPELHEGTEKPKFRGISFRGPLVRTPAFFEGI